MYWDFSPEFVELMESLLWIVGIVLGLQAFMWWYSWKTRRRG